jgi:hypothetical protein
MIHKTLSKKAIFTAAAASMFFAGCSELDDLLPPIHGPGDDTPVIASSSSHVVSSSSVVMPYAPFETWYGFDNYERIMTGFDAGDETSGYWYTFDDNGDGGASRVVWPVEPGNEYDPNSLQPIVEHCDGICGTFVLNKGTLTYQPYMGLAFDLAGQRNYINNSPTPANASSMGGVCITYTSDYAPTLEMSLGEEVDAQIGYALPAAALPKSKTGVTKFIPWSNFKQPTWYKGDVKFTGEQAAKQLVSLRFRVQGAPGTSAFNITAFGDYNGCGQTTVTPPGPIDPPQPITGKFQTWSGSNGEARIITGHDTGTETSGYWFSYSDDMDGGRSTVIWPVEIGSEYSSDDLYPVIDYCNGLCGTAALDKGNLMYNPFVGVGFLVAGEKSELDHFPAATDASDMGGICISYTSDVAPALELGLSDDVEATIGYALPTAFLPKSVSGTTKFLAWSDFKQPSWYKGDVKINGEQAAKQLVSIKFKMQAAMGNYNFNIQAIGPYIGGTCALTNPVVQ